MDETNILLERLKANDEAAYQELFEIYFKQLHHFAERMVFDTEVAHDLVQDVFISLYENSKKLSARSNLSGWLFVSVRNSCLKYLRDRNTEEARLRLWNEVELEMSEEDFSSVVREEGLRKLRELIDLLPGERRKVILMSMDGMSG